MEQVITVTEQAASVIKDMMVEQNEPNAKLRFAVHGGGCSGLTYGLGFDQDQTDDDMVITQHGITILVRKEDIPIIKGTEIDYKQQALGGGFTIENPNAIATCGCGSSFRTKEVEGTPEEC